MVKTMLLAEKLCKQQTVPSAGWFKMKLGNNVENDKQNMIEALRSSKKLWK
jgi:hypothetical protein